MLGGILAAAMSGLGLMSQSNSAANSFYIDWMNYQLQKETADENKKLAEATRTDALGNSVSYVPGQGFVTKTTPATGKLLNAIQYENTQRATTDARIKREALLANALRRRELGDAAHKELNDYEYGPRKSQGGFEQDALDVANYGYDRASRDTAGALGRQALRAGNSSALTRIQEHRRRETGDNLVQALLKAKSAGASGFAQQESLRGAGLQRALALSSSASQLDPTPMGESDAVGRLQGQQNQQFSGLSDALLKGASMQGSALNNISDEYTRFGQMLGSGFNSIGSGLSSINFDMGGSGKTGVANTKSSAGYDPYDMEGYLSIFGKGPYRSLGNTGAFQ